MVTRDLQNRDVAGRRPRRLYASLNHVSNGTIQEQRQEAGPLQGRQ
jgi:hypothetical protein